MPNALQPDTSSYGGYGDVNRLLATAGNSPQAMGQTIQNAQNMQQLSASEYALANKRLAAFNDIASSIVANPSSDNLTQRISDAVKAGVLDPDTATRALTTTANMTDQQRQQWAFQHSQTLASYQQRLDAAYGAPGTLNTGGQIQSVRTRTGPDAGTYQAGGPSYTMTQDPNAAAGMVTVKDGQGVEHTMTSRQAQGYVGYQPPQPGPGITRAAPGAPLPLQGARSAAGVPQPTDAQGRALGPDGRPTVAPPYAPNVVQNGPALAPGIAGPAPGAMEAAKVTSQAGAEQGVALQRSADGAPIRKAMLANLNDDLDKFTSGPGADWQQVGKAWANRNVLPQSMQFDPQSIASQESFNKQATQLAQQQFQSLGGTGTDSQLSSTFKANPNQALSQLGNRQIIQLLQGNEDAIQAKAKAWQDWQAKNGSGSYGAFQQDFNKTYNPRVYQAMYMDPQQIAAMRKNMSPAEQRQFANDYVALKNKGYIGGASNGQ